MIRVVADAEALAREAARLVAAEAERCIRRRGRFALLLSGGETPQRAYSLLADTPLRERVPWHGVHLFWGDERCVPPQDPRSNQGMVRRLLAERVPLPPANLHPLDCAADPGAGAGRYEEEMRRFFPGEPRFDLVLLGLGEDGHTASLFPGAPLLEERQRLAGVARRGGEGFVRVSVTLPVLDGAELAVFLVSGEAKREVLRRVLGGEQLPAARVAPRRLLWLVDEAAATGAAR